MSQNFENLVNAPVSSGYFSFKSEKNWVHFDTSKYKDLFTVDIKKLSTLYNCIPFNKYMEVEEKYFTKDQLTYLSTDAEYAKQKYEMELLQKKKSVIPKNDGKLIDEEEDLDFLLSLKEPIKKNLSGNIAITDSKIRNIESKIKNHSHKSKPIDVEEWLDTLLDDSDHQCVENNHY